MFEAESLTLSNNRRAELPIRVRGAASRAEKKPWVIRTPPGPGGAGDSEQSQTPCTSLPGTPRCHAKPGCSGHCASGDADYDGNDNESISS